jgi:glycosyltransferase involved in cell wall biosynthesis
MTAAGNEAGRALPATNVVFMGNFLYPRGMAGTKRVQLFVDAVRARPGMSASVLLLRQGHAGRDDTRLEGSHEGVAYTTVGADLKAGPGLPLALLRFWAGGCRWLRERQTAQGANVVFLYGQPNLESLPFLLYARLHGYRVVCDIVEDAYNVGPAAPWLSRLKAASSRLVARRLHRVVDGVIVISSYLEKKFAARDRGRLPIVRIPVSVDLRRLRASSEPFHAPVRVFYAGTFAEKDGFEYLLEAFERVADDDANVELRLTGKGMAARMAEVEARISASRHAARIRYLGFLSDDEYFQALSACDLPCVVRIASEFADRGFPFKLGEYLASGRPVIASRVGDIPELLVDGESAFLVEPGSTARIAKGLQRALADPAAALRVGGNGRRIAEANFDAAANGAKLLALLREVTGA